MWFATMVLKNLWQRKLRTGLTCLGMGIAVCAVVTMVGVADVFERAVTQLFQTRGVDLVVTRAKTAQRVASNLNQQFGERFQQLSGVVSVESMLVDVVSFEEANLVAVYILGWDPAGSMFKDLHISVGRALQPGDRNGVLLGFILAKNLDKRVGDKVEIEGKNLDVMGVYESANLFENSSAIVALSDLQRMMDRPKQVTAFLIRVEDSPEKKARIEVLRKQIEELHDEQGQKLGVSAMPTQEHVKSNLELRVVQSMAWSTSFIALVIGVIGILNTMMISVFERTREIGTLRAIGWRKSRVVRLLLLETLLLSLSGAVLGVLMSLLLTWILSTFPSASALMLPTNVTPSIVAQAVVLSVVTGVIGATYPAVVASRLLPTEALRHE